MNELKTATLTVSLAIATLLVPRAAQAQEWTRQSFVLPKGGFEITGSPARPDLVRMNLSKNQAFEPVDFPVNFFWGVSSKVMIGITHERGLRLNTGVQDPKFRDTYNDVGFGSVIFLGGGHNYEVDLHAGVPLHQLSPEVWVGAQIGVLGRANVSRKVALIFDPSLYFGFNQRDQGNGDELHLPIWVWFQPTHIIAPFVGTALEGTLRNFGDNFRIPLEGGVLFTVAHGIHIGAMLRFPNALGKRDELKYDSNLDARELTFLGQFRF